MNTIRQEVQPSSVFLFRCKLVIISLQNLKSLLLSLLTLFCVLHLHGQTVEVKEVLARAEKTYDEANDHYYDGDYRLAEKGFFEAKALYKSIDYDTSRAFAKTTYKIGDTYRHLRENKRALEVYNQTSELYAALPDKGERHLDLADILLDKAAIYSQMYQPARALIAYDSCLTIYKNHFGENADPVANTLMNSSLDLMKAGQYRQAEKNLLEAFEIFKVTSDSTDINFNRIYSNLGYLYRKLGDYDRALTYGEKALEIKLLNYDVDHPSVAKYHANLGKVLQRLGRAEEAIPYFQRAYEIALKRFGESHKRSIGALGELGDAYADAGRLKKARRLYTKAGKRIKQVYSSVHPYAVSHTFNLGLLDEEEGNYEAALSAYGKTLTDLRSMEEPPGELIAYAHAQIAHAQLDNDQPAAALEQLDSALQQVAPALVGIQEPSEVSGEALILIESETNTLDVLSQKAEAYVGLGNERDSIRALGTVELAVQLMQRLRNSYPTEEARQYLREEASFLFELGVAVAQKLNQRTGDMRYLERALDLSSTAKSGQLKDHFRENNARQYAGISAAEREYIDNLETDLRQARAEYSLARNEASQAKITQALLAYENAEADLRKRYPKYGQLTAGKSSGVLKKLQATLRPNSYLIDYVLGEHRLSVTLVGTETHHGQSVALPTDFSKQLELLQTLLATPSFTGEVEQQQLVEVLTSLYALLIQPLKEHLPPEADLIVCADDALLQIPFELLTDGAAVQVIDYRSLPYLLQQHAISYTESPELLLQPQTDADQRNTYKQEVLGFAPSFSASQAGAASVNARQNALVPLLNTPIELAGIRSYFGGLFLVGEEAKKSAFERMSASSRILHLATHAHMDDQEPLASGIYFSEQEKDSDAFLSAAELYGMNLPAQLAVLSACNTGSGYLQTGEGMKSLAHAFRYAGCESVVASRWLANDASTAKISTAFYEQLAEGVPKNEALRRAKLAFLAEADALTAHPFFWAGMGLHGEAEALSEARTSWRYVWLGLALLAGLGLFWFWKR